MLRARPLYSERYGAPRMRQKHMPTEKDSAARAVRLGCFERVLGVANARYGRSLAEHLANFRGFLESSSAWMVNAE